MNEFKRLNTHLVNILESLQISSTDRETFTKDAQDIQNRIMKSIQSSDPLFKGVFRGLSLTGSFLDGLKLHVPDEFDLHVKLDMPFDISVKDDLQRPGFVFLYVGESVEHPIVSDGYVDRELLQSLLRKDFSAAVADIEQVECSSGHCYKLQYTLAGYGCAHTIVATDVRRASRAISFDFVAAFEFPTDAFPHNCDLPSDVGSFWFAVPQTKKPLDSRTFMVCAPQWERLALHDKNNLKNALRLLKALRDANDMSHLTSYMLKTVFLIALKEKSEWFWKKQLASIVTKMLGRLLNHLERRSLSFYLDSGHNHFDRLSKKEIRKFRTTVKDLLLQVKELKRFGRAIPYADVAKLFGLDD